MGLLDFLGQAAGTAAGFVPGGSLITGALGIGGRKTGSGANNLEAGGDTSGTLGLLDLLGQGASMFGGMGPDQEHKTQILRDYESKINGQEGQAGINAIGAQTGVSGQANMAGNKFAQQALGAASQAGTGGTSATMAAAGQESLMNAGENVMKARSGINSDYLDKMMQINQQRATADNQTNVTADMSALAKAGTMASGLGGTINKGQRDMLSYRKQTAGGTGGIMGNFFDLMGRGGI